MVVDADLMGLGLNRTHLMVLSRETGTIRAISSTFTGPPRFLDDASLLVAYENGTVRLSVADGREEGRRAGHVVAARDGWILMEDSNWTELARTTWEGEEKPIFDVQEGCQVFTQAGINATHVAIAQQCGDIQYDHHDGWQILLLSGATETEGPRGSSPTLGSSGALAYVTGEGIVVDGEAGTRLAEPSNETLRVTMPRMDGSGNLLFRRELLEFRRVGGVHESRWTTVTYQLVHQAADGSHEETLVSVSKQFRIANFDVSPDGTKVALVIG